jgi:uncharacterized protein (DUF885 family)
MRPAIQDCCATLLLCSVFALGCGGPRPALQPSAQPAKADAGLEAALAAATTGVDSPELAKLLRDHWDWQLRNEPLQATTLGVRLYDDQLPKNDAASIAQRYADVRGLLARADALQSAALSPADATTLKLFARRLRAFSDAEVCRSHEWQISSGDNPVSDYNYLPENHRVETPADGANLVARYRQVAASIDNTIAHLRAGAAAGRFSTRESIRRVVAMVDKQVAEPLEQWPLMRPAGAEHAQWSPAELDTFRSELRGVVETQIKPALERYGAFLKSDILPKARDDAKPGLVGVPGGDACYQALIVNYTTLPKSAQEVHALGLQEIERINDEMRVLAKELWGDADLAKALDRLRNDRALYFNDSQQVETAARDALAAAKARIPEFFRLLPKTDCVVRPIPLYEAPYTTIAYYRQPFPDGSKPGEYFINTYEPAKRPRFEARVLAYHESIPGHHLQIAISQELEQVPAFRRYGGVTAFVEGWGLYSERLAGEMGLYPDKLDRMGVLSFDAWRASRLVVDSGMHALGWSRQQAIDFMLQHTALTPLNIDNEVDRYISTPGQALAYKIGQLEILRLRERARTALGPKFDIRSFHDAVLGGGAVSLEVLADRVDSYVRQAEGAAQG